VCLFIKLNPTVLYPYVNLLNSGLLHEKYLGLAAVLTDIEKNWNPSIIDDAEFRNLKLAWHTIRDFLTSTPPPSKRRQIEFINKVLGNRNKRGFKITLQTALETLVSFIGYEVKQHEQLADPEFVEALRPLAFEYPTISKLTDRILHCLKTYVEKSKNKLLQKHLSDIVNETKSWQTDSIVSECRKTSEAESSAAFLTLLGELKSSMPTTS
jgi:hypothetical protein